MSLLSEKYREKLFFSQLSNDGSGVKSAILNEEEVKLYGRITSLEAELKYAVLASEQDGANKIYWDELARLSKEQLDELIKKYNL